ISELAFAQTAATAETCTSCQTPNAFEKEAAVAKKLNANMTKSEVQLCESIENLAVFDEKNRGPAKIIPLEVLKASTQSQNKGPQEVYIPKKCGPESDPNILKQNKHLIFHDPKD